MTRLRLIVPTRLRLIAPTAVACAFIVAPAARANILPTGQWDLNEDSGTVAANDDWGSPNGALGGDAAWSQGRFQDGLSFSGNGSVTVPDSSGFEGSQVTVSAWVEASGSPGDYRYIVAKGGNGCCTGSYGLYTGAEGGLMFYVATSDTTYVTSPDAGARVWNGQWHNVIGTYDGSAVRLYVDGQQIGSGSPNTAPIRYSLPANDLAIGNYPWCPGLGFVGAIDEVKVFNRALGAQEIALAYKASSLEPQRAPFDLIL